MGTGTDRVEKKERFALVDEELDTENKKAHELVMLKVIIKKHEKHFKDLQSLVGESIAFY